MLITPWQYPPRLGKLIYISYHALAISAEACYSNHALAVSAEAWQAILYLITPWQYPPRIGMLFYILSSRSGSIRRGFACYSISYHALAVSTQACNSISYHAFAPSAEAWHAILYFITPWQHQPKLGMLVYILLGSIRRGLA